MPKGFDNQIIFGDGIDLSGDPFPENQLDENGKLLIGSTTGNPGASVPTSSDSSLSIVVGDGTLDFQVGSGLQPRDPDLDAIAALTGTGIAVRSAADTWTLRDILGTADFIDVTNGDGVSGDPTLDIATNFETTGMHGWNGSILETVDIGVTSDGATITFSAEQSGGGDLTVVFSDGYYDWDTTPADTVTLTAGSDTSPQINYVYFLQSTKALTVSTSDWPSAEHAPLATVLCQSAASLQTDGAYKVHAWTDHVKKTSEQGHIGDLNFWIRQQNATWRSGVAQTYTITPNGGAADNVILTTASGNVLQLHPHTFPAFAGTPDVYVVNDSVTPYNKITDLNALLTDSTGASMSGRFFSLVIWGVVSEDASDCKLFCNLPSGSYNNSTGVEEDLSNFSNYTIPNVFKGTGFLISEWKLQHNAASGGTWTSIDEIDLRGLLPSINAGGSPSGAIEFIDNTFRIQDDSDNTRKIAFQADQISSSNTRTITMADEDIDLTPGSGSFAAAYPWTVVTGTSQAVSVNNGYIANHAVSVIDFSLPASANEGDSFKIVGRGAGLWKISQGAGQTIYYGDQNTTTGAGGSLDAIIARDSVEVVCVNANVDFQVVSSQGNLTVV